MRVLIAPDRFWSGRTAAHTAADIAAGLGTARPALDIIELPVADGGEGTISAVVSSGYERVTVEVSGPAGARIRTAYARSGDRAVVELAAVCGSSQPPGRRPQPMTSSTFGVGEMLADAIDAGATEIVIGTGGSDSTDGGAGMAQALGARLLDANGNDIPRGAAGLHLLRTVELTGLQTKIAGVSFVLAADNTDPLLGPNGAAHAAQQIGATAEQARELEANLSWWAAAVDDATGTDHRSAAGAGSGGGTGFAASALFGARARPGAEAILDIVGFRQRLQDVDLVITGMGHLDRQTQSDSALALVARRAREAGIPVVAVVGHTALSWSEVQAFGLSAIYPLSDLQPDSTRRTAETSQLLRLMAGRIALKWCGSEPRRT